MFVFDGMLLHVSMYEVTTQGTLLEGYHMMDENSLRHVSY